MCESDVCGMMCVVYVICYVRMCSMCVCEWCMWYGECDMLCGYVSVCVWEGMIWYVCGVWCMDVYCPCDVVYAMCVLWSVLYMYMWVCTLCVCMVSFMECVGFWGVIWYWEWELIYVYCGVL